MAKLGIYLLMELRVQKVQLVANQFSGTFEAHDPSMQKYLQLLKETVARFEHFKLAQLPRSQNKKADALSKLAALTFSHFQKQAWVEEFPSKSIDRDLMVASVIEEHTGGAGAYLLLMVESDELNQHDEIPARVKPFLFEFADVFPTKLPTGLPPIRGIEHQIDLVPGSVLPNKAAYRCSPHEAKELEKQVNELVAKGYVITSMSPCSVPAFLVPKKDGSMRMCVDSRAINNITIKYRHPIPRLDDMLGELHVSCVFSKVDLRSGYHQIRMKEGDEWKTAFKIKGGLFEWLVMPFGLSNAPRTFMRLMNEVLRPLIVFLGYVVSEEGISMDLSKVEAIRSWPTLNYINGQHKLNPRHTKWVEFLQMYSFVSKHKAGTSNVVADALSRRYSLLSILEARVLGFSFVKELYEADQDFAPILNCSPAESKRDYVEQDGFLFKGSRLCIPKDSIRELLIREAHGGGLAGHFGINKTLEILSEHFYWPCMDKDVKADTPLEPKASVDAVAKAKEIKKLYEQVLAKIEKTNQQYKAKANQHRKQPTFIPGDLVWIHLRKERFPAKRKNKLMPRAEGPFKVLGKVGDNAYKVELPGDTAMSSTFNVGDLMPYLKDDNLENLRSRSYKLADMEGRTLPIAWHAVLLKRYYA
ncbi:uncharacterized protein [Rutidosis leptorrhynchoides]|uniref:uncharacterized protein n=1 Tax=Rutidosis leptorrhynchoides TaxID=125765 RepID=UPI003A99DDD1